VTATTTPVPTAREASAAHAARAARNQRGRKRHSLILSLLMTVMLLYALLPLFWLVVNSTKTPGALFSTFGLWFGGPFALWSNIHQVLLAVPTFLLFSHLHLTNTPWSVIIPSLVSPFGLYLIWVYAQDAVPAELLEAARIDGAGEVRTFFQISLRLLTPGVVTVLLFTVVATWNNYFLPLIMLSTPQWYPLTVGLNDWDQQSFTAGGQAIYNLVITGSLLTVIPIMIAFLVMQRYWRSGLAAGSVKQ
jgi:ABC-type glycerol-3-phosphate transport system permease component